MRIYILSILVFFSFQTHAANIYVDPNATGADNGTSFQNAYTLIGNAFATAQAGDIIKLAGGTYTTGSYGASFIIEQSVTLEGGYNPADGSRDVLGNPTIFSGDHDLDGDITNNTKRLVLLDFLYGSPLNITFDGITFEDTFGNQTTATDGGVFSIIGTNQGLTLTIRDCKFFDNHAQNGGVAYLDNTTLLVENCEFNNNSSAGDGGAIWLINSSATITGSFFNNCFTEAGSGGDGGAIWAVNSTGDIQIQNCNFTNNSANDDGGAVYSPSNARINVLDCSFDNNNAVDFGGALHLHSQTNFTISNNSFTNCDATVGGGGAIYAYQSSGTYTDNYFQFNTGNSGGALLIREGVNDVNNSHFFDNTANAGGGAIEVYNSQTHMSLDTLVRNTASQGGGIAIRQGNTTHISNYDQLFFHNNTASINGGGLFQSERIDLRMTNSTFKDNTATDDGAAFYLVGEEVVGGVYHAYDFNGVVVEDHTGTNGSIFHIDGGRGKLENISVLNNHSPLGEIAYVAYAELTFRNSSFRDNTSKSKLLYVTGNSELIFYHNILKNNTMDDVAIFSDNTVPIVDIEGNIFYQNDFSNSSFGMFKFNDGSFMFLNNTVYANNGSHVFDAVTGTSKIKNNIFFNSGNTSNIDFGESVANFLGDPLLKDPVNGDFTPLFCSPVVDAGDAAAYGEGQQTLNDLNGSMRQVRNIDVGATEYNAPLYNPGADNTASICQNEELDLNTLISGNVASPNDILYSNDMLAEYDDQTGIFDTDIAPGNYAFYYVVIDDVCRDSAEYIVTVNPVPALSVPVDESYCEGTSSTLIQALYDGSANLTWVEGFGFVADGSTVSPTAGTYHYVATATFSGTSCSSTDTTTVEVLPNPIVTIVGPSGDHTCSNESATITASGGNSYSWNTGDNTASIDVNPSTTTSYTVTATGVNLCTTDLNYTLYVSTAPTVEAGASQTVCEGEEVTLMATGYGANSIVWDNSVVDNVAFIPSSSAKYKVTVNDLTCSNVDSVDVFVNLAVTLTAPSLSDNGTCNGTDGTIVFAGLEGNTNYEVTYDLNSSTQGMRVITTSPGGDLVIDNLASADYSNILVVQESTRCEATDAGNYILFDPLPPVVEAGNNATICEGDEVTLVASGYGGASISWNNNVTDNTAFEPNGTGAIVYTVTATENNCTSFDDVTITVTELPSVFAGNDITVCDGNDITLTAQIANGVLDSWNNSVVDGVSFSPLATQNYIVTALNGSCSNTDTVMITVSSRPMVEAGSDKTICPGETFYLEATGADNYSWSDNLTNGFQRIAEPGVHEYIVLGSSNGCPDKDTIQVTVLEEVNLDVATTNASCGATDGSATLTITGNSAPYGIVWSSGMDRDLLVNDSLSSGMYSVEVTDNNDCKYSTSASIAADDLTISTNSTAVSCYGDADGEIDMTINGNGMPFEILWSNGSITEDLVGLAPGVYDVSVVDANDCEASSTVEVIAPEELSGNLIVNNADCGTTNGSIVASPQGGSGNISITWYNVAGDNLGTGTSLTDLTGGSYNAVMVDDNGCSTVSYAAVNENGGPTVEVMGVTSANCQVGGDIDVEIQSSIAIDSIGWSNGANTEDLTDVPADYYSIWVIDQNGCVGMAEATITSSLPENIDVCLVTVDTITTTNLVVWQKPVTTEIDYFNIYREGTQAGNYLLMASLDYDSLSQWTDTVASPMVRSWRYKISAVDNCGNESAWSPEHKTIHLLKNVSLGGNVNLIWDDYEGFSYSTYNIWRRTDATGWEIITQLPASSWSYSDNIDYQTTGLDYFVEVVPPFVCTSTKARDHRRTRSNRTIGSFNVPTEWGDEEEDPGTASLEEEGISYAVFPNPADEKVYIRISENVAYDIIDIQGKVVAQGTLLNGTNEINTAALQPGMYQIRMQSVSGQLLQKLIIQ